MQTSEKTFLKDKRISRKGKEKEQPWREYKNLAMQLSQSYVRIGEHSKAHRCLICGSWLEFKEFQDDTKKLHHANFCKVRLCPMCSWRRSKKIFGQVSKIMNYMTENHDYEYVFLTLTVRNVVGNDLSKAIDILMESYNRLTKTKEYKKLSKGYFRALEVTKKINREDFHPHIHVIIAVNKSYFDKGVNTGYLSHKAWMNLWRKCANLNYDPWVHICKVKADDGKKESGVITYAGAVSEVAKYTVKGSQFILDPYQVARSFGISKQSSNFEQIKLSCQEYTDEMVKTLDKSLKGRRLVSFGGKMRDVHKLLNLDDPAEGDLIKTDNDETIREDLDYVISTYRWNVEYMNYVLYVHDGEQG